jgi:hypothetical protein
MTAELRLLCAAAVAAAVLSVAPASAQESPELPPKGAQPEAPAPFFYKGKGPGRGNDYVERFEEDYSYLRGTVGPGDTPKFIPFDEDGQVYMTLNGEIRFRFDDTDHKNFAIATAATPPKLPGGLPAFTPAAASSTNELYKQRYELGADLHLGPYLRFYGELYHGQQTGHDVGPVVPGNLRDDLGLVNGFGEVSDTTADTKTGLRAGRQEVFLGNSLQVRANVSTNLPSPVFDGFRAYRDWGNLRLDAFAYNLVDFGNEVLQDRDNARTNLWGLYASYDLPVPPLVAADDRISVDAFYLGWRSRAAANGPGSGVYDDRAFLNGARLVAATGAGFVQSQDHRHTFGLRAYGGLGDVDYDWQVAYQAGSYAGFDVDAFAVNTDTGYTFHDWPWKPRIGAHVDAASGGADKSGAVLHTYQPMYPNTQYYVPNNEFAPTNFYDLAPRVEVRPTEAIRAEVYYSFLWRYAQGDAIYTGAPWPGANGQNNYAATALAPGKVIGRQFDARVLWAITPHILTLAEAGIFYPGAAIRATGGKTTTYLDFNLTLRF